MTLVETKPIEFDRQHYHAVLDEVMNEAAPGELIGIEFAGRLQQEMIDMHRIKADEAMKLLQSMSSFRSKLT